MNNITHRKARLSDLNQIIELLLEDELGQSRESKLIEFKQKYKKAFHNINNNKKNYLMIVEKNNEIVGTCHLIINPSLTFCGSTRMQIEAVRIKDKYRGQKIGSWMINQALIYAKQNDVSIIQITTNKKRTRSKNFYEKFGFHASHEGMVLYKPK